MTETAEATRAEEAPPAFQRILLKLSGEALMGDREYGLDPERIAALSEEIPGDELASERAIYEQQADVKDKPEDVRAKIVEGRLRKEFLATAALAEQPWIHDTSQTVAKALLEAGAEVLEFVRYALAE